MTELRGTILTVWHDGIVYRFEPLLGVTTRYRVHVPVGWYFRPDSKSGVVLCSVFGVVLPAESVMVRARLGRQGFSVVEAAGFLAGQKEEESCR